MKKLFTTSEILNLVDISHKTLKEWRDRELVTTMGIVKNSYMYTLKDFIHICIILKHRDNGISLKRIEKWIPLWRKTLDELPYDLNETTIMVNQDIIFAVKGNIYVPKFVNSPLIKLNLPLILKKVQKIYPH